MRMRNQDQLRLTAKAKATKIAAPQAFVEPSVEDLPEDWPIFGLET